VMYRIVVSATNTIGTGDPSEHADVTPATVPDAPRAITAVRQDRGADVTWDAPLNDGGDPITGYRVRIWRDSLVIAGFDTSLTSVSVPGLTNGLDYRITVTTLNSVGESVAWESVFVTPISPPVVGPPVVDPPVVEPPIVDPPIVDPPVVDPPPAIRPPSPPVDVAVISATQKYINLGWRVEDSGGVPVIDFIVQTSRHKNRGFTVWPDFSSATPRVELRKPRRGGLYVRVITVTARGESAPSQATWVARATN
jgi:hypothetical protein